MGLSIRQLVHETCDRDILYLSFLNDFIKAVAIDGLSFLSHHNGVYLERSFVTNISRHCGIDDVFNRVVV